jgi:hypothetical protein
MRTLLHLVFLFFITASLYGQKDSLIYAGTFPQQDAAHVTPANVVIYPVPVRENNFTIKTDREISLVRITNIIGQDIYRVKYNNPEQQITILLNNPKRGMYLVTINFRDGTRVVKKIMIEESE